MVERSRNFFASIARRPSVRRQTAAASACGSRFAFHFSPGAAAQTTRSYAPGGGAFSLLRSKCACESRFAPTKPAGPISAVVMLGPQYSPPMQGTVLAVDDDQANLDSLER